MNRPGAIIAIVGVVALLVLGFGSMFTVHQAQQAIVIQLGEPKRVISEPGLQFKIPFVQSVVYIDKRMLAYDSPKQEVIASDQKRLVVDTIARYRINDALRFYQTVGNEATARDRLNSMIESSTRRILGNVPLTTVVSGERADLMRQIKELVNAEATSLGIDIVDVRIRRADLPQENSEAIYRRMQTERQREAKELRAQGAEEAQRIRAASDRERTVLLADARRQSDIFRGEGEAEKNRIFAEAFNKDPDFFNFYRTMQAYREALHGADTTTLVLSPDSEFFRYFNDLNGGEPSGGADRKGAAPAPAKP
jgi:membrane protease subunit HflC